MKASKITERAAFRGEGYIIPWMNPSWSSLDKSSKVFPLVSGISKVEKIPVIMKKAKISRLAVRRS
jgi:hypothetical protein